MSAVSPDRFLPVNLDGEGVIVTAGASGIGRTIAEGFLARGARVAICDVDEEALDEAKKNLSGAECHHVDVTDRAAVMSFVDDARKTFGHIDVLINNAGIAGPTNNVEDIST